jgi:hypothetical protein
LVFVQRLDFRDSGQARFKFKLNKVVRCYYTTKPYAASSELEESVRLG